MVTPEKLKQALALIAKSHANYAYFFDKLDSLEWLEPLAEKGLFVLPPPAETEGDLTYYRGWPESGYLARMARQGEEHLGRIYKIIAKIPQTDNYRVHLDLAEAMLYLDPADSARWAKQEAAWIGSQEYLPMPLPDELGKVVASLAHRGKADAACDLARALFAVRPPSTNAAREDAVPGWPIPQTPRTLFEPYSYGRLLKKHTPALIEAVGEPALLLLVDLLEKAISLSLPAEEPREYEDPSYIWRKAIEHGDSPHADVRDSLVTAVRDAAEKIGGCLGKRVLPLLENRQHKVFQRIGLYLRRQLPELDPEGTGRLVVTRKVIEDLDYHHEVFRLLQERFSSLPKWAQEGYLDLAKKGPDTKVWLSSRVKWGGERPSDEDAEAYAEGWRFRRLLPVRDYLTGTSKKMFARLQKVIPEPAHPDYVFFTETVRGSESPKTAEDLRAMTVSELMSFLRDWKPTEADAFRGPSIEGLSAVLTQLISSDPGRYSPHAVEFRGIDPCYVRVFLGALRSAAEQEKMSDWHPVLALCAWVLEQPIEIQGRVVSLGVDPNWTWSRSAVADLISSGLKHDATGIPNDSINEAWALLELLAEDPPPSREQEGEEGQVATDLVTLAINNTRGKAIEAVIEYALSRRRSFEKTPDAKERIEEGFQAMAEVGKLLDRHLDPAHEQSLAVHALYGLHFPFFSLLDNSWTAQNVEKIFPSGGDAEHRPKWTAAWEAYIGYCHPYNNPFELIRKQYARAVKYLTLPKAKRRRMADPELHLAEHLVTFYSRGRIELADDILVTFYANASDTLRAHVLDWVGRGMCNTEGDMPKDVLQRFEALWEWRLEEASTTDSLGRHEEEIASFGWWFASGKFGSEWAFTQLEAAIGLVHRINPDFKVVNRLSELVATETRRAVASFRKMVDANKGKDGYYTWGDDAHELLRTALSSADEVAREEANDTIHLLGSLGYRSFRRLLEQT